MSEDSLDSCCLFHSELKSRTLPPANVFGHWASVCVHKHKLNTQRCKQLLFWLNETCSLFRPSVVSSEGLLKQTACRLQCGPAKSWSCGQLSADALAKAKGEDRPELSVVPLQHDHFICQEQQTNRNLFCRSRCRDVSTPCCKHTGEGRWDLMTAKSCQRQQNFSIHVNSGVPIVNFAFDCPGIKSDSQCYFISSAPAAIGTFLMVSCTTLKAPLQMCLKYIQRSAILC